MKQSRLRRVVIVSIWILVWGIVSAIVNNKIYFVGPVDTLKELAGMIMEGRFWLSVGASLLRIYLGLLIAFVAAWISATIAWRIPIVDEILSPIIAFFRSVPVAAVVVVLLIWFGAKHLVLYISFMVIFPNLYGNFLTGYKSTDLQLIEMAKVFRVPTWLRFRCLYRPAYLPYLATAMPFCIGMGYKSGVAAEIIGLPDPSIGERIYSAKIYLNTAGVFAWIVVILLLNLPAEKLVSELLKKAGVPRLRRNSDDTFRGKVSRELKTVQLRDEKQFGKKDADHLCADHTSETTEIVVRNIRKEYDGSKVLNIEEVRFVSGEVYCIMGESGAGKTTLLKILAGIIRSDSEDFLYDLPKVSMCFQENRLLRKTDVMTNLYFTGCGENAGEILGELLPEDLHKKNVEQLSGGELRRVALARAVLSDAELLLLDEPFTGLDEENKIRAAAWIRKYRQGRTMIVVTHDPEDVRLLDAKCFQLSNGDLGIPDTAPA